MKVVWNIDASIFYFSFAFLVCIVYSSDVHSSSRIYDSVIYFIDKRDNLWTKKKDNKNSTV